MDSFDVADFQFSCTTVEQKSGLIHLGRFAQILLLFVEKNLHPLFMRLIRDGENVDLNLSKGKEVSPSIMKLVKQE